MAADPARPGRPPRRTALVAVVVIALCVALIGVWAATRPAKRVEVAAPPSSRAVVEAAPVIAETSTSKPAPTPTRSSRTPTSTPKSAPRATRQPTTTGGASVGRLFAADSPWNTPVPAGAALDPQSAAISKAVLTDPDLVVNLDVVSFGIPFYAASASTPRIVLGGRGALAGAIPLDPSWQPNAGADHKLNVLDPATSTVYELQGYDPTARTVDWMVKRNLVTGLGDGTASGGRSGPTGSGMSQAAGVIRIAELKAGRIGHALSFITSSPIAGKHRYPATSSDGRSTAAVGIEEGMRIQLDPSLDLTRLHLGKAEYAIARALQVYGAYCVDSGGGNNQAMGFYAEMPTRATGDPYASLGIAGDWAKLTGIPRSAYRVLAASVTTR